MCNHPRVLECVEELIGGPVKHAGHARGLYTIFPTRLPRNLTGTSNLHRDSQPFQVGIVVYLRDVEVGQSTNIDGSTKEGGGAYTILPGTHIPICKYLRNRGGDHDEDIRYTSISISISISIDISYIFVDSLRVAADHSMASEYHSEPGPDHMKLQRKLTQDVPPVRINLTSLTHSSCFVFGQTSD